MLSAEGEAASFGEKQHRLDHLDGLWVDPCLWGKIQKDKIPHEIHGRSNGKEGAELSLLGAALCCAFSAFSAFSVVLWQSRQPKSSLRNEELGGANSFRV